MNPERFIQAGSRVSLNGTEIFSIQRNLESAAMPVVLIHGVPSWSWMWRTVISETEANRPVIAVDLPGFGMSLSGDSISFAIAEQALTINELIDRTFTSERPVCLIVHDFGALVGLEMIRQRPERFPRLVILNTSLRWSSWSGGGFLRILSIPLVGQLSMALARPWMLRSAMNQFVANPSAFSDEAFEGYWYPFQQGFGQSLARFFQSRPVRPDDFVDLRGTLASFPGEMLVLWGGRDPAFTHRDFEDICALPPNVDSIIFNNASHFLAEERPLAVARAIDGFLSPGRL
jgi:pimeloyl-ACP methyl ester carboxylesterase